MAGWVKLWRKMMDNGHLKMPGNAFKLWIYCLLKAEPFPDRSRGLEAGELLLNYELVRQMIGTNGRQMSKSTVSGALKYLEDNGYLKLEARRFYGVKARVVNWGNYQPGTESVPVGVPEEVPPSTETVPAEGQPGTETVPVPVPAEVPPSTETVPVEGQPGTKTVPVPVPAEGPSSTETVPVEETTGTKTVPIPVLVRPTQAYSGAASQAPKNVKNRELKNKDPAAAAVEHDFEKEFGRPLTPFEVSRLTTWQKDFSLDLIKEALARAALKDKRNMAYIGGILTSWRQAGISTAEAARREKPRRSRQTRAPAGPATQEDPAVARKKEFIKSLYL